MRGMRNQQNRTDRLLQKWMEPPELIGKIEAKLKEDERSMIQVGLQEGLALKAFCAQSEVRKVVDIGTQYGCSSSWMAMGLGEGGQIYSFEKDPETAERAKEIFGWSEFKKYGVAVQLFVGDAKEFLTEIDALGPFDLVFIDANKSAYLNYWQWAKKNLRPGGYILADNVLLSGTIYEDQCPNPRLKTMWKNMKHFLQTIFEDSDFHSYLIPSEEGLLVSQKK